MKRNLIMAVFAVAVIGGINVFNVQRKNVFSDVDLTNVEALAGCEVSSDDKKNTGRCKPDVDGLNEYCVAATTIWETGPKCSGTI